MTCQGAGYIPQFLNPTTESDDLLALLASHRPLGQTAIAKMPLLYPVRVLKLLPLATSHSLRDWSSLKLARVSPSGLKATAQNPLSVILESPQAIPCLNIPEFDGLIFAGCSELLAIGAKDHSPDLAGVVG